VFVIFQRLHSRETYTGTGIGLALCKKIVDFHGGRIWLDTSYVDGARLCLTLPDPSSTEHAEHTGRIAASQIPTLEGTRT
jgi:light-regulated signal transduction histidine kinase (bacteriophytochrome)